MNSPSKQKVLIIDDERSIADTLNAIFSTEGYETRVAYSAEQSISMLEQWDPALAVIDIPPTMNDIQLAILLKAIRPSMQLLLIADQPIAGVLGRDAIGGAHNFKILAKPTSVPVLLDSAARLLDPAFGPTQNPSPLDGLAQSPEEPGSL